MTYFIHSIEGIKLDVLLTGIGLAVIVSAALVVQWLNQWRAYIYKQGLTIYTKPRRINYLSHRFAFVVALLLIAYFIGRNVIAAYLFWETLRSFK